jgi:hypothetical protein
MTRLFKNIDTTKKLNASQRKKIFTLLGFQNQTAYLKTKTGSKQQAVADAVTLYNTQIKPLNVDIAKTRKTKTKTKQYESRFKKDLQNKPKFRKNIKNDVQFESMLKSVLSVDKQFLLSWGGSHYTLSDKKINDLRNHRKKHGSFFVNPIEAVASDTELLYQLQQGMVTFRDMAGMSSTYGNDMGGFFDMVNKSPFDLSEFQIFNDVKKENYENQDCCFLHALQQSGQVSEMKMNELRSTVKCKLLPKYLLKELCASAGVCVGVRVPGGATNKKRWYPRQPTKQEIKDKTVVVVEIGLINKHYFLIKKVPITRYALVNCYNKEFTALDDWQMKLYVKSVDQHKKDASQNMNSFDVIDTMYNDPDKYLTKMSLTADIYDTIYYNQFNNITTLDYDEEFSVRLNVIKKVKEPKENDGKQCNKPWHHEFFDFETTTKGCHRPYLACSMGVDGKFNTFVGRDPDPKKYDVGIGLDLLNHCVRKYRGQNVRLYAHNAGYDLTYIRQHLTITKLIERGHSLLRLYGKFFYDNGKKHIDVEVQCSMSFIAGPLSGFKKMFQLACKKEVICHAVYNPRTLGDAVIRRDGMLLSVCKKYYEKDGKDWGEFLENAEEWGCLKEGKRVDIIEYSRRYCIVDCELLRAGWLKFESWIRKITKLDVNDFISISSLTDCFYRNEDVYDGVYEMAHHVQEFHQRSMVGGRCMLNSNKKRKTNYAVDDYDATSLYPSSQFRMKGYLRGKPKVLSDLTYQALQTYDGYFVEIVVKDVGIHREFPLMSYITESKTRHFTNDMAGKTMYVDKYMLEDMIEFQHVTFDIVRGYYYNEGRNEKLADVVLNLFNERVKMKAEGNPIEVVYKLMLNSSYGKTLMKPFDTETHIMTYKKAEPYIVRNYNKIKSIDILGDATWGTMQPHDKLKIKTESEISTHFNNAHCGCEVLSCSKRIMNEVLVTAEDNHLQVLYQDTDSLHIACRAVPILEGLYESKYGRVLRGKKLGQFHGDFDSKILSGDVYAVESVFLGKKVYLDKLTDGKTKDDEGNLVYDYHSRMKGVNKVGLTHRKDVSYDGDIMAMYLDMFDGKTVGFDMCGGGVMPTFDYQRNGDITSKTEFIRRVKF